MVNPNWGGNLENGHEHMATTSYPVEGCKSCDAILAFFADNGITMIGGMHFIYDDLCQAKFIERAMQLNSDSRDDAVTD